MLYNGTATDVLTTRPNCDICHSRPAIADAKTHSGPWAYLCEDHFNQRAGGLGVGRGQILLCGDDMDEALIARYLVGMRSL
jgi:hypothetical protein